MDVFCRQVAFVLLLIVASSTAQDKQCSQAKADLAVIIDASGSIAWKGPENWPAMLGFVRSIIDDLAIGQDLVRISLVAFSTNVSVQFNLNRSYNKTELKQLVNATVYTAGRTNTAGALDTLRTKVFTSANGDRPGVDNLAIIITDGQSTNAAGEAVKSANATKNAGIQIVTIGVTKEVNDAELETIASKKEWYFKIDKFTELQGLLATLLSQVCVTQLPVTTTPVPVSGCPNKADVFFMVDSSGSIREKRFQLVKDFLKTTVNLLDVDGGNIRVGMMQFSTSNRPVFLLNKYTKRADIIKEVDGLPYVRGTTNTAGALNYVMNTGFTGNGERSDSPNIVIIITDGGSNDMQRTLSEAFIAKTQRDITIISVGVGDWVNDQEVDYLASYPYQKNRIRVNSFNGLNSDVATQLRNAICNNVNECGGNPCRNGGQCIDSINTYYCVCRSGFAGKDCTQSCRRSSDVVLNLDTSGSVGKAGYQSTLDFTANLLNALPITNMGRVGFTTYASDVQRLFRLNQMSSKARYMNALGLAYNGGSTNTASSITFMYNNMFQGSQGDRTGVQNVGITVTDGKSDDAAATFDRARDARSRGIHMVAVGVGSGQNSDELESISSYPSRSNVLSVANTGELGSLVDSLVNLVCNNVDDCNNRPCQNNGQCSDNIGGYACRCSSTTTGRNCERRCGGALDLIFAIDSSGSIHHERFPAIINFLMKIVDEMEIASDRTRIGAVRFADNADVQFHLNKYSTKQDIFTALRRIQFVGGRTNTAAALRIVRQQMFTTANGDRSNVQNMLILLTDGASNNGDSTVTEAINARVANIHIISVGIGLNAKTAELRSIASQPTNNNLITSSFRAIDTILSSVVAATCDDTNECSNSPCQSGGRCIDGIKNYVCVCTTGRTGRNCERSCSRSMDVAFILDVSGSVEELHTITETLGRTLAYGLHVNQDRVRISLITFSTTASLRFNLNKYTGNLPGIINAMVLPQTGGRTNIGAALSLARSDTFSSTNGDRSGVANKIVLVTDGNVNENRINYSTEATSLRNAGVEIYVVGVSSSTTSINNNVINDIATNPDNTHTFSVSRLADVPSTANSVLNRLCA